VRRFNAEWERSTSLALRDGDPAALDAYQRHGRLVDGGTAEQAETSAARAWLADTLAGRESLLLVSSNAAADRASAALRAELVTLGRVAEQGVELGRQGTVAGVGDLVQARRNGWELLGWGGNTAAPINRAAYRVTALREDGGLTVAPIVGRGDDGEQLSEPIQLPGSYVAADLTLGYASTVHAAQGRTVDTAHAVIGGGTDAAGAYVALTRGRDRNTAHVVTTATGDDAATGQAHEAPERTARAVLAGLLTEAEVDRSALAEAEQADIDARSTRTHGDRLVDLIDRTVTAGRTGAMLDRLAADGALTVEDRERIAADDALGSVERMLRTAELAGHDPADVLDTAVRSRGFADANHPAQVLYRRLSDDLRDQLSPRVGAFADLIPADGVPPEWAPRLAHHADAADQRRRELGAAVAEQPPQWAREALGAVPDDAIARAEWEHRAGWAAAYRELADHTDAADPLGSAPAAGLADKFALWHTAHNALDLPDRSAAEAALSDGALRLRVRALQREEAWAPRYVGDELDATEQAAQRHRADAAVWAARADSTTDDAERDTLHTEAQRAQAEADALAERAAQLEEADTARATWYAATAATRDAAARARVELGARGIDLDAPHEQVTAADWLAAHRAEQAAEDPHRIVRDEAELADIDAEHDNEVLAEVPEPDAAGQGVVEPARAAAPAPAAAEEPAATDVPAVTDGAAEPAAAVDTSAPAAPVAETDVPDVRDTARPDPAEHAEPAQRHRVPTVQETAADVAKAQAALREIEARRAADAAREAADAEQRENERRGEELARWAEQDRAAETEQEQADARGDDDVLTLGR
jgi:hypothetical protein